MIEIAVVETEYTDLEGDKWTAFVYETGTTGTGPTREDAIRDLADIMEEEDLL